MSGLPDVRLSFGILPPPGLPAGAVGPHGPLGPLAPWAPQPGGHQGLETTLTFAISGMLGAPKNADPSNGINNNDKGNDADAQLNTDPITMTEIEQIVKRFKKSKAPGPDDITTDLVKELNVET